MALSLKIRRVHRSMPLLVAALGLSACAINSADAQSSTPARVAQGKHACAATMGLNSANIEYEMCVPNLLQTIASLDQAALVERDRRACRASGFERNTREFALCVIDPERVDSN